MEHWRDIVGYEGLYQVSDLGRVKSLNYNHTGKERVLSYCNTIGGYLLVGLRKDGKKKLCRVHRLVAEAFLPNPYGLPQINHKDENPSNNIVTNLEWCDAKYNVNYGTRNERIAKAQRNHPNKSKYVYQYTIDGLFVRSYLSGKEVERQSGYAQARISACCCGRTKTAYGFVWSYTPINNQRINLF